MSATARTECPTRTTMPTDERGIYRKFDVRRVDCSDHPGGKHHGCAYFVLDLHHDEHAADALAAYVGSCREKRPMLAAELTHVIDALVAARGTRAAPAGYRGGATTLCREGVMATDTERLDFLERFLSWEAHGGLYRGPEHFRLARHWHSADNSTGATLRQAIDAAMQAEADDADR